MTTYSPCLRLCSNMFLYVHILSSMEWASYTLHPEWGFPNKKITCIVNTNVIIFGRQAIQVRAAALRSALPPEELHVYKTHSEHVKGPDYVLLLRVRGSRIHFASHVFHFAMACGSFSFQAAAIHQT